MHFHRGVTTTLLTLTFAMASALPAVAQTKKVAIGGRPTPGQTIRLNIVQDADLTMKPSAGDSQIEPQHLQVKTTTVVSQKVGTPDEQGTIKVEMIYEDVSQDMSLNDRPAPPEAAEVALKIKGKTLSMTIDAKGDVVDVTPPADFPMPPELMKDMLKQALGLMPRQDIAVGETVTAPFAMAMPLPIPGDPPQLKGDLQSTLTDVAGGPGNEVATLEQVVAAAVDATVPSPTGGGEIDDQDAGQRQGHDRLGRQRRPRQGQHDDHDHHRFLLPPRRRRRDDDGRHHRRHAHASPLTPPLVPFVPRLISVPRFRHGRCSTVRRSPAPRGPRPARSRGSLRRRERGGGAGAGH